MSVLFFNGPPGAGKTFHGTAYALHCLDKGLRIAVSWDFMPPPGVPIFDLRHEIGGEPRKPDISIEAANACSGPVVFRFEPLTDIFGLRDCQVFKDEAQNDLGARDWEKLALRVRIWMSEHRHYRVNLFLYTQFFKFVDVYPRRLAMDGGVYSIARFLNLTLEFPRPDADSETGELRRVDLLGTRIIIRPWRHLDLPLPWPSFFKLVYDLSPRVPAHYTTHAPHALKKNSPAAAGGATRTPSAAQPKIPLL